MTWASACLGRLAREVRLVAGPIAEAGTETVHCRVLDAHAAQHHFERHDGKRPAAALAGKHELARQLRLAHALARSRPRALSRGTRCSRPPSCAPGRHVQILPAGRLRPSARSENFAGARRGQDRKAQAPGRRRLLAPGGWRRSPASHCRGLPRDARATGAMFGEQVISRCPRHRRRVLTGSVPLRLACVEMRSMRPRTRGRRLGFRHPDRPQDCEHSAVSILSTPLPRSGPA